MRFGKRGILGAIATTFLAAGLLLPAGGAVAAVPEPLYDGTNPATTGCSADAYTIASYSMKDSAGVVRGIMDVRYSPSCETNWVRTSNTVAGTESFKYIKRISTYNAGNPPSVPASGLTQYSRSDIDAGVGSTFGLQVYAPGSTCISVRGIIWYPNGATVADTGLITIC